MDGGRADRETPNGTRGVWRSAMRSPDATAGMAAASVGRGAEPELRPLGATPRGETALSDRRQVCGQLDVQCPLLRPHPEEWSFRACPQRHALSRRPHRTPLGWGNSGVLPLGSGSSRCLVRTGGCPSAVKAAPRTHSPTRGCDL